MLPAIDAVGRRAIASAADASARLGRGVALSQASEQGLRNLEALARDIDAPPPRPWSFFGRAPDPVAPPAPTIETLVGQLERERDNVARALLGIETDRTRLRAAADALADALALVRACAAAMEAAARELVRDHPARADFLRDVATARLLAREQDILTQAAVTEQGVLTLGLLVESHDALLQALGRARDTSIAALRTAIAARGAITGSVSLTAQAAALDRTAAAAEREGHVRPALHRALDDAIAQARRAIAAQDPAP